MKPRKEGYLASSLESIRYRVSHCHSCVPSKLKSKPFFDDRSVLAAVEVIVSDEFVYAHAIRNKHYIIYSRKRN